MSKKNSEKETISISGMNYDEAYSYLANKDLDMGDNTMEQFINTMKSLTSEHQEFILTLIIYHYTKSDNEITGNKYDHILKNICKSSSSQKNRYIYFMI